MRHISVLGQTFELPALPGEFLLGELSRLAENRGLATRGLDIRDVLTLTGHQYEEWSRIGADHPWPDQIIRPYRATIAHVPPMSKDNRQVAYVAPAPEIIEGLRIRDPVVEYLADLAGWKEPRPSSGPWPKRLGDLEAIYAEPPATAARYAIADGDLPIRIAALDEREAPAQNLFLMAGDRAVPALALSRVFHVWTYATLSRSRGWPSRFTLGRTFESFPLPEGFLLRRHGPELALLTIHPSAAAAEPLARFEHELQLRQEWPVPWSSPVSRKRMNQEVLHELLDIPLLGSYDLPPDASDLQIIRRLVEFNRYRSRD